MRRFVPATYAVLTPALTLSLVLPAQAQQPAEPAAAPAPPAAAPALTSRGGEVADPDEWKFGYSGYFRAPFRVGIGKRDSDPNTAGDQEFEGQSAVTLHRPVVPDDQYLSWQHTNHALNDWAELFFSYGNAYARGVVAIQGYQFTDASWSNPDAQFGIGQGWLELNSDLGFENVKMLAKVGSFWSRYGMAGRYDAGEYDTYLFGRTHVMGETVRFDIDIDPTLGVWFEHGLGARRPDPSIYNRARFTMLHHGHAGLLYGGNMEFTAHYLHSWTQTEAPIGGDPSLGVAVADGVDQQPDGGMTVLGADARMDFAEFGMLYAGFSHIIAEHAITVAPAVEVIHSFGGGQFNLGVTDNYLESPLCSVDSCSGGNGSVSTILGQYELGLGNLVDVFSGGQDLLIKLYGMYNMISLDEAGRAREAAAGIPEEYSQDGVKKLKFGTDLEFLWTSWFGVGFRADWLSPHSEIPEQSFGVLSPRLVFKSDWATHEEISIQYSRYIYNQRTCAIGNPAVSPFSGAGFGDQTPEGIPGRVLCVQPPPSAVIPSGFGAHTDNQDAGNRGAPTTRPDVNVVTIQASMWW